MMMMQMLLLFRKMWMAVDWVIIVMRMQIVIMLLYRKMWMIMD
jgi:hypothetical protein